MNKRRKRCPLLLMMGEEMRGEPVLQPLRTTILLVALYMIIVLVYIWISGLLAARVAVTIGELRRLETIKGFWFVIVSSAGLFLLAWPLLHRIAKQERTLLDQRDALIAAERRAVAGVFASSVAHDINNILMLLRYDVEELLRAEELNPEHKTLARELRPAVEDLAVMSKRLASAGQETIPGQFVEIDLVVLAKRLIDFARLHAKLKNCSIDLGGEHSLKMLANPTIMRLMLLNLLLNAGDATKCQGRILVKIQKDSEGRAVIEVHDNGPGVHEQEREMLFAPFYTTKKPGDGAGLGLVSVRVYAEAHDGQVEVQESPLGGACFRVRMPIRRANEKLAV